MGAEEGARGGFEAAKAAVGAGGLRLEVVAIGVEMVFDEILIKRDVVMGSKAFGAFPGL